MKIVTLCGAGVGASAMLATNARRVLQRIDVDADVVPSGIDNMESDVRDAQVVLATREWVERASQAGWADVIEITNVFDLAELESKLGEALL